MARLLTAPLILLLAGAALRAQPTDIVITQNALEFHSAFWPNLHGADLK
jgi:hypothetical protein